tara:strand:- start:1046 stop:1492 length:447 start_codon:yes stop_codon:yes gene_type:complete
MCPKAYKYVLRGDKKYSGDLNKATFITSDILPDERELNCRVVAFYLDEDSGNAYTTNFIEVRADFAQPLSLDTVVAQTGGSAIQGSTTLCVAPNMTPSPYLPNQTNKFVVARPTNQLWEITILDSDGVLLANCQNYYLELEFTKIEHD